MFWVGVAVFIIALSLAITAVWVASQESAVQEYRRSCEKLFFAVTGKTVQECEAAMQAEMKAKDRRAQKRELYLSLVRPLLSEYAADVNEDVVQALADRAELYPWWSEFDDEDILRANFAEFAADFRAHREKECGTEKRVLH